MYYLQAIMDKHIIFVKAGLLSYYHLTSVEKPAALTTCFCGGAAFLVG